MSDPFYAEGLQFECTQCHSCCRHDPGYVFLSKTDLNLLASHHNLTPQDFISKYCRWEDFGTGEMLSLVEKKNFDCIFWKDGCTVYPARPLQCRAYPFWENPMKSLQTWNYEARFCPGINKGKLHSPETIKKWLKDRVDNPILTKEEFLLMLVRFWGVRGSIPSPMTSGVFKNKVAAILNRLTPRDLESAAHKEIFLAHLPPELFGTVGGNTTCLEVRSDEDEIFIVDGGTGIRELGQNLVYPKDKGVTLHIFLSHFHWDHLQGLPFFAPFFNPKNTIHFYSPVAGFENILREQMRDPYFPVPMSVFPAQLNFHVLNGNPLVFGGMKITYRPVYHPQGCTAYRFEESNRTVIFSTDTELKTSDFLKVPENVTFYEGVDVLILDAQYTLGEAIDKTNWGHSSYSMAVDFALEYGIKKLFLFHHEPNYSDAYLEDIKRLAQWYLQHNGHNELEIDLAREGVEVDL